MQLKDLKLGIEVITGRFKNILISSITDRYVRDENGKATSTLEGWNIAVPDLSGSLQMVKVPLSAKKVVEDARKAMGAGNIVLVASFLNFKATPYAVADGAKLRSGISCSADGLTIQIVDVNSNSDDELISL